MILPPFVNTWILTLFAGSGLPPLSMKRTNLRVTSRAHTPTDVQAKISKVTQPYFRHSTIVIPLSFISFYPSTFALLNFERFYSQLV